MLYNKSQKTGILTMLLVMGICGLLYNISAEAAEEKKIAQKDLVGKKETIVDQTVSSQTITGEVGFINSKFMSIIDERDEEAGTEHESLIYLDDDVDVQRKESLDEIKAGDTVQVQYDKTTNTIIDNKTSESVRKSKKVIKGVKFLRKKQEKTKMSTLKSGKK